MTASRRQQQQVEDKIKRKVRVVKVILYWILGKIRESSEGNSVLNQSNVVKSRGETFDEICELYIKSFRRGRTLVSSWNARDGEIPRLLLRIFLVNRRRNDGEASQA